MWESACFILRSDAEFAQFFSRIVILEIEYGPSPSISGVPDGLSFFPCCNPFLLLLFGQWPFITLQDRCKVLGDALFLRTDKYAAVRRRFYLSPPCGMSTPPLAFRFGSEGRGHSVSQVTFPSPPYPIYCM